VAWYREFTANNVEIRQAEKKAAAVLFPLTWLHPYYSGGQKLMDVKLRSRVNDILPTPAVGANAIV
jgi:hypothetical protein